MRNSIKPSHLIDADIGQLTKLFFEVEYHSEDFNYIQIMMAYYLNDLAKLKRIQDTLTKDSFFDVFLKARIAILENSSYQIKSIDNFRDSPYLGDLFFAMALIAAQKEDHLAVKDNFLMAHHSYMKIGAQKKALNAQMNTITAEGNIDIRKRLLSNYIEALDILIKRGSYTSAANICVNIADEFHKVGAQRSAFRYLEKALKLLEDQNNTLQYAQALTHLCETQFCLNQKLNAMKTLKELHRYEFKEIKESTKAIENIYLNGKNKINNDSLTTAWRIRLNRTTAVNLLGEISDQLILLLAHRPYHFSELIDQLYPSIDEIDAKNRLTTLISRINKKDDGLIQFDQEAQTYTLSNNEKIEFASKESIK